MPFNLFTILPPHLIHPSTYLLHLTSFATSTYSPAPNLISSFIIFSTPLTNHTSHQPSPYISVYSLIHPTFTSFAARDVQPMWGGRGGGCSSLTMLGISVQSVNLAALVGNQQQQKKKNIFSTYF